MVRVNPEKVGFDGSKLSRIDSFFQNAVGSDAEKKEVPGLGVRIIRQGKIAFDNCYGFADQEEGIPMTEDSLMRIFSMSKPIVSAAALKLYELGAFSLDEPIKKYIPSFESPRVYKDLKDDTQDTVAAESDITIKQLFTMTSGLSYGFHPDIDKLDALYEKSMNKPPEGESPTTEQVIDHLATLPLAFHPGTDYRYSYSIDVLGRLIEVLSGKSLGDFLESELFIPLGMNDTGFFVEPGQEIRLAGLYDYEGAKREKTRGFFNPLEKPSFESGGGGLISTLKDYSHFCEMLLNKGSFEGAEILGRKTVDLMSANHLEGKALDTFYNGGIWGGKAGYGYGLGVRTMMNPAKAGLNGSVGEFGWDGAASTWMMVDPVEKITVLYMVQMFPYGYVNLRDKFVQMIYSALR